MLDDDTIQRHPFARTDDDDRAHSHLFRRHGHFSYLFFLTSYLYIRHIRSDIHQVCNAPSALPLGIALEELAYLEEEHDEDRLWKLRLSTRQKADGEGSDGGYRHQEVFVEGVAMSHTLGRLLQRLVAY